MTKSLLRFLRISFAGTLLAILGGTMQSCYYDNQRELYPRAQDSVVSYSKRIAPIMETNCFACHGDAQHIQFPSGNIRLDTYEAVRSMATDTSKGTEGRLYGAVAHLPAYKPMPDGGGKIPDADIQDIKTWVEQGARNN